MPVEQKVAAADLTSLSAGTRPGVRGGQNDKGGCMIKRTANQRPGHAQLHFCDHESGLGSREVTMSQLSNQTEQTLRLVCQMAVILV